MSRATLDVFPVKLVRGEETHRAARAVVMDDVLKVFVLDGGSRGTPRAVVSVPVSGFTRVQRNYAVTTQEGDTLMLEKDGCSTCSHPFRRVKASDLMQLEVSA